MRLFFDPDIAASDKNFTLNEEESRHIHRVLRMNPGEEIGILNGKGERFTAEIIQCGKRCEVIVRKVERMEKDPCHIHIAVAPTKNIDRIEWFLEKATEIGIHEISFFTGKNSERVKINIERIEKKLISAMKQCGRWDLPKLNDLCSLDTFLNKNTGGLIAHCYDGPKETLNDAFQPEGTPILIGPEGDFTLEELRKALEMGYKSITLGKNRLRTETAALYACMQAKLICG